MADLSQLDQAALADWMVGQRWFGSKARDVASVEVVEAIPLREELVLALVEARFGEGTHETYQLPLGLRPAGGGDQDGAIARAGDRMLYDALDDPAGGRELLRRMRAGAEVAEEQGTLRFAWAGPADGDAGDPRPAGVQQSNTSVVFGDELILKVFRRLEPGENPELELLRFLSERGFAHIPALAGWYEYEGRLIDATLGILQEYLAGARDGWALGLEEVVTAPDGLLGRLRALGEVTGEMHTALGSDSSHPAFAPDEPSVESLSLLTADVDEQIERIFLDLPDSEAVAPIAGRGQDVRERLQALSHIGAGGRVIRTHGDLHLGQTMLSDDRGWVILDFEGEPARPLPQRRLKRSPLRDVAGMLRSFSYVTAGARLLRGTEAPEGWEDRARDAYLEGYFERADARLLPPGEGPTRQLLSVFELEKAVYELRYELNNRPDWVGIPVAGIARLLETEL
jgi:trehalose synthase-fused probable maltokinase